MVAQTQKLIKMETIVAKGNNYSYNDIKLMEEPVNLASWDKMVKVVLIYPAGTTKEITTSYNTLKIVTEDWDKTIIYK